MRLATSLVAAALFFAAFYRLLGEWIVSWIDDREQYWKRLVATYVICVVVVVGVLVLPTLLYALLGDERITIHPLDAFALSWLEATNVFALAGVGFCLIGDGVARLLRARDPR